MTADHQQDSSEAGRFEKPGLKSVRPKLREIMDWLRTSVSRAKNAMQHADRAIAKPHRPQHVLAYVRDYANDLGVDVVVRARAGEIPSSDRLIGYSLKDLRTNQVRRVTFNPIKLAPAPERGTDGTEIAYPDVFTIPAKFLGESEYQLRLINEARKGSAPQYFVVRDLNSFADVGIVHPIFTWQAYNQENGGSLYKSKEFAKTKTARVSLNRPIVRLPRYHHIVSVLPFIKLMAGAKLSCKSISSLDLHEHPDILKKIKVLLIVGHDEYWTHTMRDHIQAFIKAGGCIGVFSGNVGWWAAKLNGRELYVDKSESQSKLQTRPPYSGQFRAPWINKPPQQLFGMSHAYAGYPVKRRPYGYWARHLTQAQYERSGDLTILKPSHPVFHGLGWKKGTRWGNAQKALAVELDGVFIDGSGEVDRKRVSDVPKNTKILASARTWIRYRRIMPNGRSSWARHCEEVGIVAECRPFPGGGVSLQFGTIGWFNTIEHPDGIGGQITQNAISYLLRKYNEVKR